MPPTSGKWLTDLSPLRRLLVCKILVMDSRNNLSPAFWNNYETAVVHAECFFEVRNNRDDEGAAPSEAGEVSVGRDDPEGRDNLEVPSSFEGSNLTATAPAAADDAHPLDQITQFPWLVECNGTCSMVGTARIDPALQDWGLPPLPMTRLLPEPPLLPTPPVSPTLLVPRLLPVSPTLPTALHFSTPPPTPRPSKRKNDADENEGPPTKRWRSGSTCDGDCFFCRAWQKQCREE